MAFWNKKVVLSDEVPTTSAAIKRRDEILASIEKVAADLAEMKGDLKGTSSVRSLERKLTELKGQVADMEINKSRIEEDFARERREIEHHVGLERQRTEMEIEQARTSARLDVREENLEAERKLFEKHMEFYKEQMDSHIDDVKNLLNQVMTRIPTVTVDRRIRETTNQELPSGD